MRDSPTVFPGCVHDDEAERRGCTYKHVDTGSCSRHQSKQDCQSAQAICRACARLHRLSHMRNAPDLLYQLTAYSRHTSDPRFSGVANERMELLRLCATKAADAPSTSNCRQLCSKATAGGRGNGNAPDAGVTRVASTGPRNHLHSVRPPPVADRTLQVLQIDAYSYGPRTLRLGKRWQTPCMIAATPARCAGLSRCCVRKCMGFDSWS